mmetsp:Transcript_34346/g.97558  ORF Transcript_34346/g.97558 Transcript_34346/m.97558 type:complete len:313 (-) Transcript_34346:1853-2791(-)
MGRDLEASWKRLEALPIRSVSELGLRRSPSSGRLHLRRSLPSIGLPRGEGDHAHGARRHHRTLLSSAMRLRLRLQVMLSGGRALTRSALSTRAQEHPDATHNQNQQSASAEEHVHHRVILFPFERRLRRHGREVAPGARVAVADIPGEVDETLLETLYDPSLLLEDSAHAARDASVVVEIVDDSDSVQGPLSFDAERLPNVVPTTRLVVRVPAMAARHGYYELGACKLVPGEERGVHLGGLVDRAALLRISFQHTPALEVEERGLLHLRVLGLGLVLHAVVAVLRRHCQLRVFGVGVRFWVCSGLGLLDLQG